MASVNDTVCAAAGPDETTPSHTRLVLLILEGYAYLALIVGVFLAATGFLAWGVLTRRPFITLVAILIGVPLVVTTTQAIRLLFFVFPEPKGVAVGPNFGGPLHATVEDIRQRIRAPRVHRILVTDTCNASVVQNPRAGIFWPTNTLLLGYPLLAMLSPEQMRAVIAHELGHITRAHGRFSAWVHRTRLSWMRLMEGLDKRGAVPAHAHLLFRFYVPRLHAHAVAVSRKQELLADRLAAGVTGPEVTAQALVAIELAGFVLDRAFWPRIFERVQHDPVPPSPFSEMGSGIWKAFEDRTQLLEEVQTAATAATDTHPALRDRLACLDQAARLPGVVELAAADCFFGSQRQELATLLDRRWQEARSHAWREQHNEIRRVRERLGQLAALVSPTPEQTFERAALTQQNGDEDAAVEFYRSAHSQGHASAGLRAGRILLNRGDAAGIAMIEASMDADPGLAEEGCSVVVEFLERRGRQADAHAYRVRLSEHGTRMKMAAAERGELSLVDRFTVCTDASVDASALARRLTEEPGVLRAFLVVKELRYSSGTLTVLAVLMEGQTTSDLGERLRRDGVLPGHVTIAAFGRHDQQLQTALERIAGARIYG